MRTLFLSLSMLCVVSAQAASFDCAKAKSPEEHSVCGDPDLSGMDERLGKAYGELLKTLPKPKAAQLKQAQRSWLQQRGTRCGPKFTAECLSPLYQQRLAILEFRLSPDYAGSPAAKAEGEYAIGKIMSLQVQALGVNRIAVTLSGAEPTAGRWVCDFSGEGEVNARGKMTLMVPDDKQTLSFVFKGNTAQVDEGAATSYYCGAGGTLSGKYRK